MGTKRPGVETIMALMKVLRTQTYRTGLHVCVYKWVARSFRWPCVDDMETERHVLLMTRCREWWEVPQQRTLARQCYSRHDVPVRIPWIVPCRSVTPVDSRRSSFQRMVPGLFKTSTQARFGTCWFVGQDDTARSLESRWTDVTDRRRSRISRHASNQNKARTVKLPDQTRALQCFCLFLAGNLSKCGPVCRHLSRNNSGHFSNNLRRGRHLPPSLQSSSEACWS